MNDVLFVENQQKLMNKGVRSQFWGQHFDGEKGDDEYYQYSQCDFQFFSVALLFFFKLCKQSLM